MAPAKQSLHIILLLLLCVCSTDAADMINTTAPCLPDQASSLLKLKRSFVVANNLPSLFRLTKKIRPNNLSSWQAGTDCCHWEGVVCDFFGRVTSLDLGEFHLTSRGLDPALFSLTSLRSLSLAFNDFGQTRLPTYGFEQLADIIHLNFSATNFIGLPMGIARLKNLVTLDLSKNYGLYLEVPSFRTFMANMSNLWELYLDFVDLSDTGSTWSTVLADSVPQLQTLSLTGCRVSGYIHPSFSRLRSLTMINLGDNPGLTGKVPEYISELSSLGSLDISYTNFEGQFPTKIFQLKSLRTLDLSDNYMLSVRFTYFPDENNLQTLKLAGTNCTYDMPLSFGNLKSLETLSLTTTTMPTELLTSIQLPSLNELELQGSELEKPVLSWVGNLKALTHLELSGYDFSQSLPTWIDNLTRLETLSLWGCKFSTPIPYQIGNLANLNQLDFIGCDFSGQEIPSWIGNLTKLTYFDILDCNLSGPIPSTIGNLTRLEEIQFTSNNIIGKIPKSLFALPALNFLCLNQNQLSGTLEDITSPLSSPLWYIGLNGNQLTGPIPKSFFLLRDLQILLLDTNKFTGTVYFSSIWGLKNLTDLSLSNNMISLTDKEADKVLPPSLPNIAYLYLASCNITTLPAAFRHLDTIIELDLSNNQIKGAIPSWLWENWKYKLASLDLSYNLLSTLDKSPSLVNMPSLIFLDLSFNVLQGSIPIPVTTSYQVALDYSNNNFSSIVPNFGKYLTNVIYINLSKNKLSGQIPLSVCSLNELDIVDFSYNRFSGLVPSCLIERGNLSVLKLRENKLHGVLPENIREGCKIKTLDLNGNQIEGTLPQLLANCRDIEIIDIGNNQIVDSFPSWMGTLPNLRILVLRSNQLNGTIRDLNSGHRSAKHFTSLQIIDLASNHFSGDLHLEWFDNLKSMMNSSNDEGHILEQYTKTSSKNIYEDTVTITFKDSQITFTEIQTTFKVIDFSNNSFEGPIPESIGRLVSLHGLNMSHNNFTGQIPSQLGNLSRMESLDLSWNHLSGEIPQELASLTFIDSLNLSYNNLTGRIPDGPQFSSFTYSSFEGNVGLCGSQINIECSKPGSTTSSASVPTERNSLWQDRLGAILLFAFAGLGFGVGFALAIWFQRFCRVGEQISRHGCNHM